MKNKIAVLLSLVGLFSCSDDDLTHLSETVSYDVKVNFDQTYNEANANNVKVTLESTNTSEIYETITDSDGNATFGKLIPGVYNLNASLTLSAEEFYSTFGYYPDTNEVIFNASLGQTTINNQKDNINLTLKSARIGDLVIKQIYYAGSHTTQGANLRDQFIEIHNNSNEIVYADGLYFGIAYGVLNTTTTQYVQPNGQWDWSRSFGMTIGEKANTDYLYVDYVFQIPGSGKQYPIEPGKSIVIAQTAINHQSPLVGNDGNPISIVDPSLTVDLSTADFESNFIDFRRALDLDPYKYDIENLAIPNLLISYAGKPGAFHAINDMIFDTLGRDSYVIFRADSLDFPQYPLPNETNVIGTTKMFMQIPADIVIDGVETQHASNNIPKRLPETLDISNIKVNASFSGEAVIRKTKTVVDGRVILQDTNNSANDFVIKKANPRGFAE